MQGRKALWAGWSPPYVAGHEHDDRVGGEGHCRETDLAFTTPAPTLTAAAAVADTRGDRDMFIAPSQGHGGLTRQEALAHRHRSAQQLAGRPVDGQRDRTHLCTWTGGTYGHGWPD